MTCQAISDLLPLLDDPELSRAERERVEAHLAICPSCAHELNSIRQTQMALNSLRAVSIPEGGPDRVLTAVRSHAVSPLRERLRRLAVHGPMPVGGWLAGAAILVLFVLVPTFRGDQPDLPEPTPMQMEMMSVPAEDSALMVQPFAAQVMSADMSRTRTPFVEIRADDPAAVAAQVISAHVREGAIGSLTHLEHEDGSVTLILSGVDAEWLKAMMRSVAEPEATEPTNGLVDVGMEPWPSELAEFRLHIVPTGAAGSL